MNTDPQYTNPSGKWSDLTREELQDEIENTRHRMASTLAEIENWLRQPRPWEVAKVRLQGLGLSDRQVKLVFTAAAAGGGMTAIWLMKAILGQAKKHPLAVLLGGGAVWLWRRRQPSTAVEIDEVL